MYQLCNRHMTSFCLTSVLHTPVLYFIQTGGLSSFNRLLIASLGVVHITFLGTNPKFSANFQGLNQQLGISQDFNQLTSQIDTTLTCGSSKCCCFLSSLRHLPPRRKQPTLTPYQILPYQVSARWNGVQSPRTLLSCINMHTGSHAVNTAMIT